MYDILNVDLVPLGHRDGAIRRALAYRDPHVRCGCSLVIVCSFLPPSTTFMRLASECMQSGENDVHTQVRVTKYSSPN